VTYLHFKLLLLFHFKLLLLFLEANWKYTGSARGSGLAIDKALPSEFAHGLYDLVWPLIGEFYFLEFKNKLSNFLFYVFVNLQKISMFK